LDRALYVAGVGSGDASYALYEQAREVCRLVAERGGVVICGGLSGAKEAGGTAIGILPDEDGERANPYLSYSIVTSMGQARNLAVVCSGDAVVAIGGECGTLSEIGLALKAGRLVVALESW
jgi:uncharacterized protein (TIGR00725 family)